MMVWNGQPDCWTRSVNITVESEPGPAPLWCVALRLVLWAVCVAITIQLLYCNARSTNPCSLLKGEIVWRQSNFSFVFLKYSPSPPSPHLSISGSPRKMSTRDYVISLDSFLVPNTDLAHHLHVIESGRRNHCGMNEPGLLLPIPYSRASLRWAANPLFNTTLPLTLIKLVSGHMAVLGEEKQRER